MCDNKVIFGLWDGDGCKIVRNLENVDVICGWFRGLEDEDKMVMIRFGFVFVVSFVKLV